MLVPIPCTSRREQNSFRSGPDLPGRERICLAMQQSCASRRLQQHRRVVVFCALLSRTQSLRPSEKPSNDFGRRRGREILGCGVGRTGHPMDPSPTESPSPGCARASAEVPVASRLLSSLVLSFSPDSPSSLRKHAIFFYDVLMYVCVN